MTSMPKAPRRVSQCLNVMCTMAFTILRGAGVSWVRSPRVQLRSLGGCIIAVTVYMRSNWQGRFEAQSHGRRPQHPSTPAA